MPQDAYTEGHRSRKAEVPLDHPRSGVAHPWHECLDYPGARQMRLMRDFFDMVPWWKLRPDRTLLAEDRVDEAFSNYIMASRTEDGKQAVLYLPANPAVKLNLTGFRTPVRGTWYDPRTGRRLPAGKWKPAPSIEAATPGAGDWLLLVR